jgi:hypothetical protein
LTFIFAFSLPVATNAYQQLPPLKPLEDYAKTLTSQPPFYGYDLFNTKKKLYPIVATGHVTGASIDDLFDIVNNFDSPYWTGRLPPVEPNYPPQNPKGVPIVRHISDSYEYVEMKRYSDPENHSLIYTMEWSDGFPIGPFICHVTMVDEPENNRVKVTWMGHTQNTFPFFIIKRLQGKVWAEQIEDLQTYVSSMK